MAGLVLVAWMGRYFEHRRWERDARLKAYSDFLTACDELKSVISEARTDTEAVKRAQVQAAAAWRTMSLLASGPTAVNGRIYLGALLTAGAVTDPRFGLPEDARKRLPFEFQSERTSFIAAARRDLGVAQRTYRSLLWETCRRRRTYQARGRWRSSRGHRVPRGEGAGRNLARGASAGGGPSPLVRE